MDATGKLVLGVIIFVVLLAIYLVIRIQINAHMLGTFRFDNSGDTYRCRLEFDSLDDIEHLKYAIVKIEESDLSLPGEKRPRDLHLV